MERAEDVMELVQRLLDGDVTAAERDAVRARVLADPEAAALLRAHEGVLARLKVLPAVEVPAGFEARLHARLEAAAVPAWRRWLGRAWAPALVACAAAALVVVAVPRGETAPGPAGVSAAAMGPGSAVPEVVVRVRASAALRAQVDQVLTASGLPAAAAGPDGVRMGSGALRAVLAAASARMPVDVAGEVPTADDADVRVRVVVFAP